MIETQSICMINSFMEELNECGAWTGHASLVNFLAGVITIAPSLAFALSGTSALPRVLAFSGTEPVLGFVDIAVDHELSRFLILVPVVSVHGFLIWEHLTKVVWVSFNLNGGGDGHDEGNNSE